MKLSATPFHPVTGELLPVYRDAYLRGDLSSENAELVDAYLRANAQTADDTLRRFQELKSKGHAVQPVGWVQRQFELLHTEPVRFRRRAATLVLGTALLGSAVFAGTSLPTPNEPGLPGDLEAAAPGSAPAAARLTLVRGRILDENGRPLVGATVWQRGTRNGVSTDADGTYRMYVPANQRTTLQYGYGGYTEELLAVKGGTTENVTLLPRANAARAKKRWLFF